MEVESGKEVFHTFKNAGEYIVTVEGEFGRHMYIARKEITILPTSLTLAHSTNGDLLLHNNAKYEADISGFILRSAHVVEFPKNSFIKARGTITIPKGKIWKGISIPVFLYDQEGEIVASYMGSMNDEVKEVEAISLISTDQIQYTTSAQQPQSEDFNFSVQSEQPIDIKVQEISSKTEDIGLLKFPISTTSIVAQSARSGSAQANRFAYLGLLSVIGFGIVVIYMTKNKPVA